MPVTLIESWDQLMILTPVQNPNDARQEAVIWGASLTITAGMAIGMKTADRKAYPFASGASDGTQIFAGFAMYTGRTDANGLFYKGDTGSTPNYRVTPDRTSPIWQNGVFDPADVTTAATPTANIVTFTPGGTITAGDVNTITYTRPDKTTVVITFTTVTTTATAVSNGLRAAWNANPELALLATASGTATFIVTANIAGNDISSNLASTVPGGTGTLTKANSTAAAGRAIADIVTSRPDAITLPNGYWRLP